MAAVFAVLVSAVAPAVIFLTIQTMRRLRGLAHTSGADVAGMLLCFDLSIAAYPGVYAPLVAHAELRPHLGAAAALGMACCMFAIAACVHAEERIGTSDRSAFGFRAALVVAVAWSFVVALLAAHLLFFMVGEMS